MSASRWHRRVSTPLTVDDETNKEENAELHGYYVQKEMSLIVGAHTIMYPRTVAGKSVPAVSNIVEILLVMFCYTVQTPSAVLTSYRHSYHTMYAEVSIVEFPQSDQFIDNCFLRCAATELWDIARILNHADRVEICAKGVARGEQDIEDNVGGICSLAILAEVPEVHAYWRSSYS